MSTTNGQIGRLCNQIIRNLVFSIIAKNNNLKVIYNNTDNYYIQQQKLGLNLFSGDKEYKSSISLNEQNVIELFDKKDITSNLSLNGHIYFQTKDCTNYIYHYINNELKSYIESVNPFANIYNTNNDVFVHIRLGDVTERNPGFVYYDKVLSNIEFEKGYISTDSPDNIIIQELLLKYPNLELFCMDEVRTIQFGSTCKHLVLSHGSFSAVIGYLAFYSSVYYPEYDVSKQWYGDTHSIPGWNKIDYLNL